MTSTSTARRADDPLIEALGGILSDMQHALGTRIGDSNRHLAAFGTRLTAIERQLGEQKSSIVALHRARREERQAQPETEHPLARARRLLIQTCVLEFVQEVRQGSAGPYTRLAQLLWPDKNAGEQRALLDASKSLLVQRAAVPVATMTGPGWAAELSQARIGTYQLLAPRSAYSQLSQRGERYSLDGVGSVKLPSVLTDAVSNFFIGEGMPIPVWRLAFGTSALWPHKGAGICCFSVELAEATTPTIETTIGSAMEFVTSKSIDANVLDDGAASAIRPAGLRHGIAALTASAETDPRLAMLADLKAMIAAITDPVDIAFITNPSQMLTAQIAMGSSSAAFIESSNVPPGMVIAVDAASFASGEGDAPRIRASDSATLHREDTTPLAIGTVGTPPTVAAPVSSLWQEDLIGLRLIQPVSWALRQGGKVAWLEDVTW